MSQTKLFPFGFSIFCGFDQLANSSATPMQRIGEAHLLVRVLPQLLRLYLWCWKIALGLWMLGLGVDSCGSGGEDALGCPPSHTRILHDCGKQQIVQFLSASLCMVLSAWLSFMFFFWLPLPFPLLLIFFFLLVFDVRIFIVFHVKCFSMVHTPFICLQLFRGNML